jgi:hypothetical protein
MSSSRGEGRHIAVLAYLSDGKCEEIRYNPNDYPRFSESEIAVFKAENGGGRNWLKEKPPAGVDELFVAVAPSANEAVVLEILNNREIAFFMTGFFAIKRMQAGQGSKGR